MRRILFFMVFLLAASLISGVPSSFSEESASNELEEFDFANGLYGRGMFEMAIRGYKDFLEDYPESQYAELAEYRIAESYFMAKRYDEALNRFVLFLKRYPEGELSQKAQLRKGQTYYFQGDNDTAEKVFRRVSGGDVPAEISIPARYYIANIYLKNKKFPEAVNMLKELLASSSNSEFIPFAYMTLGDVYREQKDYPASAQAYAQVSDSSSDEPLRAEAFFRGARSYQSAGESRKALKYYQEAMNAAGGEKIFDRAAIGKFAILYEEGKYDEIISSALEVSEKLKDELSRSQILFMLGNSLFQKSRYDESFEVFSEVAINYPDTEYGEKALLNSGWALFKMNKFKQCAETMDTYLDEDERFRDEAMYVKAKALALSGKTEGALKIFDKLTQKGKDPVYVKEAIYEKGWLLDERSDEEGAINSFNAFVEMYPDDARSPSVLLRKAQINFSIGKPGEAEADYKRFLDDYPQDPSAEKAAFQLGRVYMDTEDYSSAISVYGMFVKKYPASSAAPHAKFLIGRSFQKQQKWDEAIKAYQGLFESGDEEISFKSRESTAYCHFSKGDKNIAADLYFSLMQQGYKLPEGVYRWCADYFLNIGESPKSLEVLSLLDKTHPGKGSSGEIDYMYGENYGKLGDWTEAVEYYKKALDSGIISPYKERVYIGLARAEAAKGKYEDAQELLKKALDDHGDNLTGALARFEMGNVKMKTMDFEGAAKEYMMVAILYDDKDLCPEALYLAGEAFSRTDNPARSAEAYTELIERYPDSKFSQDASIKLKKAKSDENR